jgi:hypothetical protein
MGIPRCLDRDLSLAGAETASIRCADIGPAALQNGENFTKLKPGYTARVITRSASKNVGG